MRNTWTRLLSLLMLLVMASAGSVGAIADQGVGDNLSGYIVDEPITLKGMVYEYSSFNADYDTMEFFELLSKDTNINFEWIRVSMQAWNEQVSLMLASGDLPDFIAGNYSCVSATDVAKYAGTAFYDFSGLLDEYAPNLTKIFAEREDIKKAMTAADGGMYGFPAIYTELEQDIGGMPFINVSWIEKLGLSYPETTEDLYNVLTAFKNGDPNGNGVADEIPMSAMDKTLDPVIARIISGAFGFPYFGDTMISTTLDGSVYFSPACDGYKEAMKYMNKLYAEGLLDPEIFSIDRATFIAKANQGRDRQTVGVGLGGIQEQNFFGADSLDDYDVLIPVVGPNGDRGYTSQNQSIMPNTFIITTANKYPEATVQLVDRCYNELWSLQAFEGPIGVTLEPTAEDPNRYQFIKSDEGLSLDQLRYTSAPVAWTYYLPQSKMDRLIVPDPLLMTNTWENCKKLQPYLMKEVNPVVWPMSEKDAKSVARLVTDIKNFVYEKRAAWISGAADIDAEWDAYIATLEGMGLSDYVSYYQNAFDTYNAE